MSTPQAPLRSRVQINRENALKSTGPRTDEGKARSRANAVKHGMTARFSLAGETASVIAPQFWMLAESVRPMCAMGVNALLELSLCMWKNRRLFEDFAANHARSRMVEPINRHIRDQRGAVKWINRLLASPREAMIQLENSEHGLKLLVSKLQNIIQEVQCKEGYWSMDQFDTVLGIAGYQKKEIWHHAALRKYLSAMASAFPDKKIFRDDIFPLYAGTIDTQSRLDHWVDMLTSRDEGRRILEKWATQLKDRLTGKLQKHLEMQSQLTELNTQAAAWPSARNSCQHIIHLRYTGQVDRKTRQILDLLNILPKAGVDEPWALDESLLPPEWASVILEFKPGLCGEPAIEINPAEFQLPPMPVEPEPEILKDPAASAPVSHEMDYPEVLPVCNQTEFEQSCHSEEDHQVKQPIDHLIELKSPEPGLADPTPESEVSEEPAIHLNATKYSDYLNDEQIDELCSIYLSGGAVNDPVAQAKRLAVVQEIFEQMIAERDPAGAAQSVVRDVDEMQSAPILQEINQPNGPTRAEIEIRNEIDANSPRMKRTEDGISQTVSERRDNSDRGMPEIAPGSSDVNQAGSKRRHRHFRPDRASKLKPPSQRAGANGAPCRPQTASGRSEPIKAAGR